jgi:Tfp pilus assembly protein PilP
MNLAQKLWADEAGIVVSTELLLIVLILVLGLIAGMASLRDQVAQELADLGNAINHLDGSYEFVGVSYTAEDGTIPTEGPASEFDDAPDANNVTSTAGNAPQGMNLDGVNHAFSANGEDDT